MQRVATAPATRCSTDAFEVRTTSLSRDAVRARRFCHAVVALAASAWSAVALLNWTVNPYAQYAPHFIPPLVQTSRAEKVALLQHRDPRPTGLILGSSRVMKLEPTYLQQKTGLRFFNAGVNHGKIEDVLAFVRFYEQQYGAAPQILVVGLDLNGFSPKACVDPRLLAEPQLGGLIPEAAGLSGRFRRWTELLSWQQTVGSLKSLRHHWQRSDQRPVVTEFFDADGRIVYQQREQQLAEGNYDFGAALAYNQREFKQLFSGFDRLDPMRLELVRRLSEHCEQHEIDLYVFLTPLHPRLEAYLSESTTYWQRRDELRRFLEQEAAQARFQFADFSQIEAFSGDSKAFVDGIHPLEVNTRKVVDNLLDPYLKRTTYVVQ